MTTGNRTSTHTSDGRCADHGTDQAAAIAYETLGFKLFCSEKLSSSIRARKIVELALDAHCPLPTTHRCTTLTCSYGFSRLRETVSQGRSNLDSRRLASK